jgi:hypothetical protein
MDTTAPLHFGTMYANQTLKWLPTDTEENYKKLIQDPDHLRYFQELGWDKPDAITYQFNSHGFRADEFDSGPCLVALGCSHTIGIGLPDSVTWPRQLATRLNLKCANLAWGGYSADSCYRLAEYWVPRLRPDYVCMLVPPRLRIDLLLDPEIKTQYPLEVFLPQSKSTLFNPNDAFLKHWFLNPENAQINQRRNIRAVQNLCDEIDIPCTILDADDHMSWGRVFLGYARDYMHSGPRAHDILTEHFLDGYKK